MPQCHTCPKMEHSFSEEQYQEHKVENNGLGKQHPRREHERMRVTFTHFF